MFNVGIEFGNIGDVGMLFVVVVDFDYDSIEVVWCRLWWVTADRFECFVKGDLVFAVGGGVRRRPVRYWMAII